MYSSFNLLSSSYIVPIVYSPHHKNLPFIYSFLHLLYYVPSIYSTVPFKNSRIKKLYFHIIILNFIMRITETFSLFYVEAGVRIADFWFLIFRILKFKNEKGCPGVGIRRRVNWVQHVGLSAGRVYVQVGRRPFYLCYKIISVVYLYSRFYALRPQVNSFYASSPSLILLLRVTHSANIFIPCVVPKISFWVSSLLSITLNCLTLNVLALEQLNGWDFNLL